MTVRMIDTSIALMAETATLVATAEPPKMTTAPSAATNTIQLIGLTCCGCEPLFFGFGLRALFHRFALLENLAAAVHAFDKAPPSAFDLAPHQERENIEPVNRDHVTQSIDGDQTNLGSR